MDYLKNLASTGTKILGDTKTRVKKSAEPPAKLGTKPESDPHKAFVRRCIQERPPKEELVKQFKKWIEEEEAKL